MFFGGIGLIIQSRPHLLPPQTHRPSLWLQLREEHSDRLGVVMLEGNRGSERVSSIGISSQCLKFFVQETRWVLVYSSGTVSGSIVVSASLG